MIKELIETAILVCSYAVHEESSKEQKKCSVELVNCYMQIETLPNKDKQTKCNKKVSEKWNGSHGK